MTLQISTKCVPIIGWKHIVGTAFFQFNFLFINLFSKFFSYSIENLVISWKIIRQFFAATSLKIVSEISLTIPPAFFPRIVYWQLLCEFVWNFLKKNLWKIIWQDPNLLHRQFLKKFLKKIPSAINLGFLSVIPLGYS